MSTLRPGIFKVKSTKLTIRYEPRITPTNVMGMLVLGDQRNVFEFVTHSDGSTWGRVSQPDSHGKSLWVCIENVNTVFMERVEGQTESTPDKIRLYINDVLVFSQN